MEYRQSLEKSEEDGRIHRAGVRGGEQCKPCMEFFRTDIQEIISIVREYPGKDHPLLVQGLVQRSAASGRLSAGHPADVVGARGG